MRIAIAEFKQETNSFVPFTTTVQTFEDQYFWRGEDVLTAFGHARLEIERRLIGKGLKAENGEILQIHAGGRKRDLGDEVKEKPLHIDIFLRFHNGKGYSQFEVRVIHFNDTGAFLPIFRSHK